MLIYFIAAPCTDDDDCKPYTNDGVDRMCCQEVSISFLKTLFFGPKQMHCRIFIESIICTRKLTTMLHFFSGATLQTKTQKNLWPSYTRVRVYNKEKVDPPSERCVLIKTVAVWRQFSNLHDLVRARFATGTELTWEAIYFY